MSERSDLLASIAGTTADYRADELAAPTPEHVNRWVKQFDRDVQAPLLREMDHVLKQTYFSRKRVRKFLRDLVSKESKLAGAEPCAFWKKSHFLDIQLHGHSQEDLLEIFDKALRSKCGVSIEECGAEDGDFIYLDDAVFSGGRVGGDLCEWLREDAPDGAQVHIVVIALHTSGEWLAGQRLKQAGAEKQVKFNFWRLATFENRKYYKRDSDVLWPSAVPDEALVTEYLEQPHRFPFEPRPAGGELGPFSSEEGRQLLEREFLIAGLNIRGFCENPKDIMRPLGFGPFGLGFGSTILTFRNCPNNCPLALWWGDAEAPEDHPFSKWYPLFPRKTYDVDVDFDDIDF